MGLHARGCSAASSPLCAVQGDVTLSASPSDASGISWWLTSGSHTVQLIYRKNGSGTAGGDAGWVDYLRLE